MDSNTSLRDCPNLLYLQYVQLLWNRTLNRAMKEQAAQLGPMHSHTEIWAPRQQFYVCSQLA